MPSQGVRILIATKPVDFRKEHDGLAALVQSALAEDPFTGTVFVFRAKRADKLKGGDGDDTLIFTEAAILRNADKILDFDGDYDRIGLCQNIYHGLPVGALSVSAFTSNADGEAEDAADRIIYESDLGRLYYDADGTGCQTRQLIAILSGAPDLDASDVYIF